MDTEKCRALLCTLEEGTLAAAAETLGYTTSGISRMINALEEDLGFSLLHRSRKGVTPTAACLALLPSLRQILYYERCCRQTAYDLMDCVQGTVAIGTSSSFYDQHIARLITAFRQSHPQVIFHTAKGASTTLLEAVHAHRLDLCIISKRDDVRQWIPLAQDELMAMLPKNHPLAQRTSIPLKCLEEEPFIEIFPDMETDNSRMIATNQLQMKRLASAGDELSAMAMVESGMGISIINMIVAKTLPGDVVFRPFAPRQYVEIGIAAPYPEDLSPVAKRLLDFAKTHIEIFA